MAQLPLPGRRDTSQLSDLGDGAPFVIIDLPDAPRHVLGRLAGAGHEAALVGGCLRDLLLATTPGDWDVATSAPPPAAAELFPGATWENRFGTVTISGPMPIEVTSYRSEAGYRDRRRPDQVRFGGTLREDLGRRDFTINAVAWVAGDLATGEGRLVDPFDGIGDLRRGVLRAVGDPEERFAEDALRLLRATRFATRFGLEIDPPTRAAITRLASTVAALSGERVRGELLRVLGERSVPPSRAFELMEELGLLGALLPELSALRGVPQGKPRTGDALDHSLRTADALPADDPALQLAGLLHDVGKAPTLSGGHFIDHEVVGAELTNAVLRRLRIPNHEIARITHLIRQHMFAYTLGWTDAAVRRFIRRVGTGALDDLFALRAADNAASGVDEPPTGGLAELRARIEGELRGAALEQRQLAVDGHDLQRELSIGPGPFIGRLLDRLLEAVLDDPSLNQRTRLLALARDLAEGGDSAHRDGRDERGASV